MYIYPIFYPRQNIIGAPLLKKGGLQSPPKYISPSLRLTAAASVPPIGRQWCRRL